MIGPRPTGSVAPRGGVVKMTNAVRAFALGLALLGSSAGRTVAQEEPTSPEVSVLLRLSTDTGSPVGGVFVEIADRGLSRMTDETGSALIRLPPGTYLLRTSHIAYHDIATALVVQPNQATMEIGYTLRFRAIPLPPIMVEATPGLRMVERRRASSGSSSAAFDYDRIQDEISTDIVRTLAPYAGVILIECGGVDPTPNCWETARAGRVKICVYLDDGPLAGGLDVLRSFPTTELGRIEFYPSSGEVRAYTRDFLVRLGERPGLLMPLDAASKLTCT